MAKLKSDDLKNLGVDELEEKVMDLKKKLMQFRFQSKTGKLERQSDLSDTRKNIARVLTAMNAKKK